MAPAPRPSETKATKNVWSDLPRRLTTIGIGVPIFWWLLQQSWSALTLFMGIHALAAWEYSQLVVRHSLSRQHQSTKESSSISKLVSWWFFPCLSLVTASVHDDALFHVILVVTSALLFLWTETFLSVEQQPSQDINNRDEVTPHYQSSTSLYFYYYLQGLVHVTLPFHAWYELCRQEKPYCHYHTVSLLLIVWNCDNGALICGRLFGKRMQQQHQPQQPLWLQRISPSKSMVGLWGGWWGGLLTTLWLPSFWAMIHSTSLRQEHDFYWDHATFRRRLLVGTVLACLAVLGDLWESRLKRNFHTKDSGVLLPGHGGVLDRFDSSFLAVLFYRYLTTTNK